MPAESHWKSRSHAKAHVHLYMRIGGHQNPHNQTKCADETRRGLVDPHILSMTGWLMAALPVERPVWRGPTQPALPAHSLALFQPVSRGPVTLLAWIFFSSASGGLRGIGYFAVPQPRYRIFARTPLRESRDGTAQCEPGLGLFIVAIGKAMLVRLPSVRSDLEFDFFKIKNYWRVWWLTNADQRFTCSLEIPLFQWFILYDFSQNVKGSATDCWWLPCSLEIF